MAPAVALALVMTATTTATPAEAATGNQGYAVYRDGVFFGYTWHSAFLDDPHWNTTSSPVIHQAGSGYVTWASWSSFLGGKNYVGTYRPKTAATSANRDNFQYMARLLRNEQIGYNVAYQVYYDTSTVGTWVDASEVSSMRCDGVVEYVYEWYGFRVYGSDTRWDVTKGDYWNRDAHGGAAVTPKSQAQSYLTLVTTSLP
jgi:hypothetical protein